jgi:hypothetical protein
MAASKRGKVYFPPFFYDKLIARRRQFVSLCRATCKKYLQNGATEHQNQQREVQVKIRLTITISVIPVLALPV